MTHQILDAGVGDLVLTCTDDKSRNRRLGLALGKGTPLQQAVDEMMAKPPLALRAAKNVVNNSLTCDSIEAALAIERASIMWLQSSDDMKEGVAAFVEKRKPNFKGK